MTTQVLEGIRVVEFGAYAAGPVVGKFLADHGAEVIHVESRGRPDGFRTHYPPYKDNIPGINRSALFAICNNDKLDLTLNLKVPQAQDLARRLVAKSDVVIENFTPGTIARLGLGYEVLRELNPQLVMLSTCNQGQTGPHADHPGFGTHLSSLSGFTALTGYEDGPPVLLYGPYIDFIAVGYGVVAIMAALDYRRRTGQGQYIDMAQYETGMHFIAPALLDYAVNGRVAQRRSNWCCFRCGTCPQGCHWYAAPFGAFPCKGEDAWCVISAYTQQEWEALCTVMGDPDLALDTRFFTLEARKRHEAELNELVARWTAQHSAREIVERLQEDGVHAAEVKTMDAVCADPQLQARHFWWEMEHPEIGRHHYEGPPYLLSLTPAVLRRPAPLLGEHNQDICTRILGLSAEAYVALEAQGVFE